MMERYSAEETQGTEGPFEFYFQTHGAEPGELKDELDDICGAGRYGLKVRPTVMTLSIPTTGAVVNWD